jgi:integrase/recombinase XerD
MFDDFLKHGKYLRNWSPRTLRTYRQAWSSFQSSLPGKASEPTKAQLEAWVVWMRERGVSPSGCNMYIRTMNSYLSWLHVEHGLEKLKLKLLREPKKQMVVLDARDIKVVVSTGKPRTRVLMSLLLDTGLRIDEALSLLWEHVDMDSCLLAVRGKGEKHRRIPFSLELRKVLFRYGKGKDKGYVFHTRNGTKLMYRNVYREIFKACGKSPHKFRHTWATDAVRRGVPLPVVQRILGHSSIQTTMRYVHMQTEDLSRHHVSPLS